MPCSYQSNGTPGTYMHQSASSMRQKQQPTPPPGPDTRSRKQAHHNPNHKQRGQPKERAAQPSLRHLYRQGLVPNVSAVQTQSHSRIATREPHASFAALTPLWVIRSTSMATQRFSSLHAASGQTV
eukprot:6488238-Amphidinium_carterae.1